MSEFSEPPLQPTTPPPATSPPPAEIRQWHMWCHLSALGGLLVPCGNVLGPLLIWQIKKHEIPSLDVHGKAAVNFQLTVLIATIVAAVSMFLLSFVCIGWLLLPVVIGIPIAGIVLGVLAGIRANDGREFTYPWSLQLL